jgi:hypothetical protein
MPAGKEKLNPKQEKFCQLYASDVEFFGNGVASYIEVYKPKQKGNWYKSACSSASRLLRNVKACERINELLELGGLNDQFVDKQLNFLITQHADFTNKLGAIKEYNQLKQRIKRKIDKFEEGGHATEYENLTDEELDVEIKRRQNKLPKTA